MTCFIFADFISVAADLQSDAKYYKATSKNSLLRARPSGTLFLC